MKTQGGFQRPTCSRKKRPVHLRADGMTDRKSCRSDRIFQTADRKNGTAERKDSHSPRPPAKNVRDILSGCGGYGFYGR